MKNTDWATKNMYDPWKHLARNTKVVITLKNNKTENSILNHGKTQETSIDYIEKVQ